MKTNKIITNLYLFKGNIFPFWEMFNSPKLNFLPPEMQIRAYLDNLLSYTAVCYKYILLLIFSKQTRHPLTN